MQEDWDCDLKPLYLGFAVKMSLLNGMHSCIRRFLTPFIGISAVFYFSYHIIHGERGLLAWWQIKDKIEKQTTELFKLKKNREKFEHRVNLLHPEKLDPDILEERARIILNYGHPNEIIIFESEAKRK